MKLTIIFLGLLLIANKNGGGVLNNKKAAWNLPVKNVEVVENSAFNTLATKNFSGLSIQENDRIFKGEGFVSISMSEKIKISAKPIVTPNGCEEIYAAAMSACYTIAWNPPVFAICAAAATAAYAACLAAGR